MKTLKLLAILLAFAFAGTMVACNGDDGGDEDADTDVIDEDVTTDDVTTEDVQPDDVTVEDVQPDDVTLEDVTVDDVTTDDVTPDELPECADVALTCSGSLTGETTVGTTDTMNGYSCTTLDESGGERVYSFSSSEAKMVTIDITTGGSDLDIFVLSGPCEVDTCIEYGAAGGTTDSVSFAAEAGTTYYIVVDGYAGAADTFDIAATCADPEICDNGIDDNGNSIVDCYDPECVEAANCYESNCTDDTDNDGNGKTDCDDYACFYTSDCSGGTAVLGEPCDSQDDCASGQCFTEVEAGWPQGACIMYDYTYALDCDGLACPTGSTCVSFSMFGPYGCISDCDSSGNCRTGYECYDIDSDTTGDICISGCTDSSQCTTTNYCNTEDGWCTMPPEVCTGGTDEDGDGRVDCADPDCINDSACSTSALAGGENCSSAVALTMPSGERGVVMVSGTTTGAADDITVSCASASPDVVYSFTLTGSAKVTIDLIGGPAAPFNVDTVVGLFSDCPDTEIACNDGYGEWWIAHIETGLVAGTYYIVADGWDTSGDYGLSVIFEDL